MSTDYTHFTNLAFDNLFARGADGQEVQVLTAGGIITAPAGSLASASIRFTGGAVGTGFYLDSGSLDVVISNAATQVAEFGSSRIVSFVTHRFADGTTSSPGVAFSGATGSGLYRKTANTIAAVANATEVINFSSSAIALLKATTVTGGLTSNGVVIGSSANRVSGLATIINTGTITLPTATTTLVGLATSDVLTNKTISGASNTISAIADGSLSTSYLKADGTRALTANWSAGAFSATHNSVVVGSAAASVTGITKFNNAGSTAYTVHGIGTFLTTGTTARILVDTSGSFDAYVGLSNAGTGKWFLQNIGSATNNFQLGNAGTTAILDITQAGAITFSTGTTNQHRLNSLLATNGSQTATLTNLPAAATAGNPNGWISININGTTSYIPFWH